MPTAPRSAGPPPAAPGSAGSRSATMTRSGLGDGRSPAYTPRHDPGDPDNGKPVVFVSDAHSEQRRVGPIAKNG